MNKSFTNIEIVTLAVYLLKGESKFVDTEDIAVKASELVPGRFTWKKYPDQINIENVRKRLSDAKNTKKCGYLLGSTKIGWRLSKKGIKFSKKQVKNLNDIKLIQTPSHTKEMPWKYREKFRMLTNIAFEKIKNSNADAVSTQEAEAFFRLDDYVTGKAREQKLNRLIATFGDDPDIGEAVRILAKKVSTK